MTDTKSFVDSVFLARFGLCRLNALDYFLHPLNPFRSNSSSSSSSTSSSNEILAMQGISMGTLMAASSANGTTNPNAAQQQAEEDYATMLSRMKGEQYELLPPPPEHDLSAPSPLYVIRHVLRSNPTTVKVLGIYYILEGVIYKSPPVRSIRKATYVWYTARNTITCKRFLLFSSSIQFYLNYSHCVSVDFFLPL